MTQERVKCPFCSELILPDAAKCRFCGEWFSKEEAISGDHSSREDYGGHIRRGYERDPTERRSAQEHVTPTQNAGEQAEESEDTDKSPKDGDSQDEGEAPVRVVSFAPVEGRPKSNRGRAENRISWLRILLGLVYIGVAIALGVSELSAQRALHDAQAKENAEDYSAAFDMYRDAMNAFPASFAAIEIEQGLRRLSDSKEELEMPKADWVLRVEDFLGELSVSPVSLLPFVAWPACAALLLLVTLTRMFRPAAALLSLLLMLVATTGAVAQLSWCGLIPLAPVAEAAQKVMQVPVSVYLSTYGLLLATAMMTLTAARKQNSRALTNHSLDAGKYLHRR